MLFQYYGSSGAFRGAIQMLIDWGFLDALLPFLLIFILIFAVLQRVALFSTGEGDKKKADRKINGLLAMIVSLMVVVPHIARLYNPLYDPVNMINTFLPHTAVILFAIFCVTLLLGMGGTAVPNFLLWSIALVAVGFLVFIILMTVIPGFFPTFGFLRDPSTQALIIILLVLGLVGFFIIREPPEPGKHPFTDLLKEWMGKSP